MGKKGGKSLPIGQKKAQSQPLAKYHSVVAADTGNSQTTASQASNSAVDDDHTPAPHGDNHTAAVDDDHPLAPPGDQRRAASFESDEPPTSGDDSVQSTESDVIPHQDHAAQAGQPDQPQMNNELQAEPAIVVEADDVPQQDLTAKFIELIKTFKPSNAEELLSELLCEWTFQTLWSFYSTNKEPPNAKSVHVVVSNLLKGLLPKNLPAVVKVALQFSYALAFVPTLHTRFPGHPIIWWSEAVRKAPNKYTILPPAIDRNYSERTEGANTPYDGNQEAAAITYCSLFGPMGDLPKAEFLPNLQSNINKQIGTEIVRRWAALDGMMPPKEADLMQMLLCHTRKPIAATQTKTKLPVLKGDAIGEQLAPFLDLVCHFFDVGPDSGSVANGISFAVYNRRTSRLDFTNTKLEIAAFIQEKKNFVLAELPCSLATLNLASATLGDQPRFRQPLKALQVDRESHHATEKLHLLLPRGHRRRRERQP